MKIGELITAIGKEVGITKVEITSVLSTLSKVIEKELIKKEKITIPGVGILSTGEVAARTGRNPQTGEPLEIGAYTKIKFKPLKSLKDSIK